MLLEMLSCRQNANGVLLRCDGGMLRNEIEGHVKRQFERLGASSRLREQDASLDGRQYRDRQRSRLGRRGEFAVFLHAGETVSNDDSPYRKTLIKQPSRFLRLTGKLVRQRTYRAAAHGSCFSEASHDRIAPGSETSKRIDSLQALLVGIYDLGSLQSNDLADKVILVREVVIELGFADSAFIHHVIKGDQSTGAYETTFPTRGRFLESTGFVLAPRRDGDQRRLFKPGYRPSCPK